MDPIVSLLVRTTLGLVMALALRRPARALFGPGPACLLWHLPWLLPLAGLLPALAPWTVAPALNMLPQPLARAVMPPASLSGAPVRDGLLALWAAGSLALLVRLGWHYRVLWRACRPWPAGQALPAALAPARAGRLRVHEAGPAVVWSPRGSLLLLPSRFDARFPEEERALVLRHEQAHLARGDGLWRLLAECAFALLWWHPLAWLARPRLRLDCELACDDRVLREDPQARAGYARSLLHSVGLSAHAVLIPWLSEPQLKERLTMIQHHRPGRLRHRLGLLAVASLAAGSVLAAQAPATAHASGQHAGMPHRAAPRYPANSIQQREQGTVLLDVQVGADGRPRAVRFDARHSTTDSATLIGAASDAVMKWQFNPGPDGTAGERWVRVPVKFALDPVVHATGVNGTAPTRPGTPEA